jgi:hypothetical protein
VSHHIEQPCNILFCLEPAAKQPERPKITRPKGLRTQNTYHSTKKKAPVRHKEHPCRFFLPKPLRQQLPTWKKADLFNNKKTKPRTQPLQELVHTKSFNNNQKERAQKKQRH